MAIVIINAAAIAVAALTIIVVAVNRTQTSLRRPAIARRLLHRSLRRHRLTLTRLVPCHFPAQCLDLSAGAHEDDLGTRNQMFAGARALLRRCRAHNACKRSARPRAVCTVQARSVVACPQHALSRAKREARSKLAVTHRVFLQQHSAVLSQPITHCGHGVLRGREQL